MADDNDIRWGLARRFEFIEWRAYWNGRVNRKDLEDEFEISTPQASADFTRYQAVAPGNIEYDSTEKSYVVGSDFRPKFYRLSPERHLLQLHALSTGAIQKDDTWFDGIPPVDAVPTVSRGPEAYVLRALVNAISHHETININYLSLTRTGTRDICPHAVAHDGHRWHVRALSPERGEFRDYVLGRILSIAPCEKSCAFDADDDVEWQTTGELELVAHPGLDASQRATIEHDYRMKGGVLKIQMRLALAFYFIRRNNLDLRNNELPPNRAQLFLKNLDEINSACEAARKQSQALVSKRMSASRIQN